MGKYGVGEAAQWEAADAIGFENFDRDTLAGAGLWIFCSGGRRFDWPALAAGPDRALLTALLWPRRGYEVRRTSVFFKR